MPEIVRCRLCGASIEWLKTDAGKKAPIDAGPADNGNVLVLPSGRSVVLGAPDAAYLREVGLPLRLNHFVTCTNPPARKS